MGLDMDSARIHRLLGAVNDKTKTLIDEVRYVETCFVQLRRRIHSRILLRCGRFLNHFRLPENATMHSQATSP